MSVGGENHYLTWKLSVPETESLNAKYKRAEKSIMTEEEI
jgi:hypothetical protein